jgi:hypothetical protein
LHGALNPGSISRVPEGRGFTPIAGSSHGRLQAADNNWRLTPF